MEDSPRLSRDQIDALAHDIMTDAAIIAHATYELLVKIRRFDQAKGWARQGAKSCAHWLTWRIGVGVVAARQKVRVAHRLLDFPLIAEAFRKGELSYTKVRAVVRDGMSPEKDEVLLHQARGATGSQLERISAAYRRYAPETKLTDEDRRYVRKQFHRDGTMTIAIRLLPDEAERLYQAISETKREMAPEEQGDSAESSPTLADAAVAMAEAQLARIDEDEPSPQRPAAERRQLFVHLREERIADETAWKAELHDGTPLAGETLKRLACDCGLVVAKTDEQGNPLDIGRRRRTVSAALLRALFIRDRHCQFPSCNQHHQAFLEAHHIEHWLDHGPTNKSNTVLTCTACHLLLHEGGFRAERKDDGSLVFYDPTGSVIEPVMDPPELGDDGHTILRNRRRQQGIHIDHHTNLLQYNGSGLDLHAAVDALFTIPQLRGDDMP